MKDTKRKQKVFEDNDSVPQYYFGGGAIKEKGLQAISDWFTEHP